MKKMLRHIMLVTIALTSLHALAFVAPEDTLYLYFYNTWDQMLNLEPVAEIADPLIGVKSPYEIYIATDNPEINNKIENEYIAFSLSDTSWYVNSSYIKRHFEGDVKQVSGYVPLYFNEKTAFVISYAPLSVKDILFGNDPDGVTSYTADYYYLDFRNRRLERVTHSYLSTLLEDYRDLLMRYEGMKEYKKPHIIEEYFFKFIDSYTDDLMTPRIVDIAD